MCLIPKESAKIVKEDIVVYKILLRWSDRFYMSPFRGAIYQIEELKTANIKYNKQLLQFYNREIYGTIINEGLHAYTTKASAVFRSFHIAATTIIVKAIIPRGAMYVLGVENDIVSTQLKLIEECH